MSAVSADIRAKYRASFSGRIDRRDLGPVVRTDENHSYYRCPCGGKDHLASLRHWHLDFLRESVYPAVLHCWEWDKTWFICTDVVGTIRDEEAKAEALLDSHAKNMGRRVGADEAFRLVTEQGCPEDFLEIEDREGFAKLMRRFRDQSRKRPVAG